MRKHKMNNLNACLCAAVCLSLFSSCKDDYIYDDEAPAWLGENIYEYLEKKRSVHELFGTRERLGL